MNSSRWRPSKTVSSRSCSTGRRRRTPCRSRYATKLSDTLDQHRPRRGVYASSCWGRRRHVLRRVRPVGVLGRRAGLPRAVVAVPRTVSTGPSCSFPLPIVAAVQGPALAGGFDLAVMCDIRGGDDGRLLRPSRAAVVGRRLRSAGRSGGVGGRRATSVSPAGPSTPPRRCGWAWSRAWSRPTSWPAVRPPASRPWWRAVPGMRSCARRPRRCAAPVIDPRRPPWSCSGTTAALTVLSDSRQTGTPGSGTMCAMDEATAFLSTLQSTAPTAPTACTGWTAHDLVAHLTAGAAEMADLTETVTSGHGERATADFASARRRSWRWPTTTA